MATTYSHDIGGNGVVRVIGPATNGSPPWNVTTHVRVGGTARGTFVLVVDGSAPSLLLKIISVALLVASMLFETAPEVATSVACAEETLGSTPYPAGTGNMSAPTDGTRISPGTKGGGSGGCTEAFARTSASGSPGGVTGFAAADG